MKSIAAHEHDKRKHVYLGTHGQWTNWQNGGWPVIGNRYQARRRSAITDRYNAASRSL